MTREESFINALETVTLPSHFNVLVTDGERMSARWIMDSAVILNRLGHSVNLTVLVRHPDQFLSRYPRYAGMSFLNIIKGNPTRNRMPDPVFDGVFHFGTDPRPSPGELIQSTRYALEWARSIPRFLYVGNARVYADPPANTERISEPWIESSEPERNSERFERLAAERLCHSAVQNGQKVVMARVFNLIGLFCSADPFRAPGSFFNDAINCGPIVVHGDGTEERSYLSPPDLARALWTLLWHGQNGTVYNVASERVVNQRELAEIVAREAGDLQIVVERPLLPGNGIDRFIGDTSRLQDEFGIHDTVTLEDAIAQTLEEIRNDSGSERSDLARARAGEMNLLTDQV
jgi:nucleoside-diphosphate-sugar epimerase